MSLPRLVIPIRSPRPARRTNSENFCLNSRKPTLCMTLFSANLPQPSLLKRPRCGMRAQCVSTGSTIARYSKRQRCETAFSPPGVCLEACSKYRPRNSVMHGKQMNYLAPFGTFIAGLSVRLSASTVLGKASLRSSQGEKSEKISNVCGRDYPADGLYRVRVCQRQAKIQSE